MRGTGWRVVHRVYGGLDALYRRLHHLERVGSVLYLGRARYGGAGRTLADGTRVDRGDVLGVLHFDNQFVAELADDAGTPAAAGLAFARALLPTLTELVAHLEADPAWEEVPALRSIGWFARHGERFGFEYERLPPGPRARWLRWHILSVLWAFNPEVARRERERLWPMEIWISRRRLAERFGRRGRRAGGGR